MRSVLIVVGWGVLALGIVVGAAALGTFVGDSRFAEVAEAYARHPDHALFQAQYWATALPHYGLLTLALLAPVVGLVAGVGLLAQAAILRRLPRGPDVES